MRSGKPRTRCRRCRGHLLIKGDTYCASCYVDNLFRDCAGLKQQLTVMLERNRIMEEIVKECFVPKYPTGEMMSPEDHQAAQDFYGLEGYLLYDRLMH